MIKSVCHLAKKPDVTSCHFVSDGKGCHVTYIRGDPAAHGGKCGKVQNVKGLFNIFVSKGWQIHIVLRHSLQVKISQGSRSQDIKL